MKHFLLFLFAVVAVGVPGFGATPKVSYNDFIKQLITREALAECAQQMDVAIDDGEKAALSDRPGSGWITTRTRSGLQFQFRILEVDEAIVYYITVSRGGDELKYSDAAKLAAFFADRAGLTHPVDLMEAEKPFFQAQWLIRPKQWKALRKMMLKVRAENRAEKDPINAFALAVEREMTARDAAVRARR